MRLRSFGLSDVGKKRKLNEDSYLSDEDLGLFIVADGVGGQAKGEVASAMAVEEAHGFVKQRRHKVETFRRGPTAAQLFTIKRLLESAVQSACYMVFGLAEQDPERHGMSTTMSALLISGDTGILAQVGDSRVYRFRDGKMQQLTEDHTLVNYKLKHGLITAEEAKQAPGKNVITRAVGHRDYVQVDTITCHVQHGDRFMLCSDGLHIYFKGSEPEEIMALDSLEHGVRRFIDLANSRGGQDNITAMIVAAN